MFTGRTTNRAYWKLRNAHNADRREIVTPVQRAHNDELMNEHRDRFYGFLLYGMMSNTTKSMSLSFNMTFSMNYFGLSRTGIQIMGDFGYSCKLSSFDKYKKLLVTKEANKVRYDSYIQYFVLA